MTLSFTVFAYVLASFGAFLLPDFFSFHFGICFTDVLMSGIWNEIAVLEDLSLRSLVPDLLDLQMGSRASSTVTNTSRAG